MDFIPKELDEYVSNHTQNEPEWLYELNRETHLNVLQPRMLSGHFQGRVLSMISKMIQPTDVLEIGTYTGYSALCMAEGLAEGGHIVTIDRNEELADLVQRYIAKSPYEGKIKCVVGDAMDIVPGLKREFDLVFIDADKENYINYYHQTFDKVRSGGYFLFDNVLWSGKVIEPVDDKDIATKTLIELNTLVHEDDRVEEVLLPIRDGLLLVRKK
ncbi:MAG: O-methyltransferase [Crocinitomicaceae bacterium]